MKKIKVWLQYPFAFADSPYYKYLVVDPPKNVKYANGDLSEGVILNKTKFRFSLQILIAV